MRNVDQLCDKLDSIKRWLKKVHDEERAHSMATGGGPAKKKIELSPNMNQLAALMTLSIEGLKPRPGDSDYEAAKLVREQDTDQDRLSLIEYIDEMSKDG